MAVKPPGPGICRVCCTGVSADFAVCLPCLALAEALGEPLAPITAVSLTTADSPLYRWLREYKWGGHGSTEANLGLAALLTLFLRSHLACAAGGSPDAVVVVPSLSGRRPPPHPLLRLLWSIDGLPPILDCLAPGEAPLDHGSASRGAVECSRYLKGMHVLVFDDTCTSGARIQSAAFAVRAAGASVVQALVIGRFLRKGWPGVDELLRWSSYRRWDPKVCIGCATPRSWSESRDDVARRAPRH